MADTNKKSTTRAKVLTVVLIVLFFGSVLCIVLAGINGSPDGENLFDEINSATSASVQTPSSIIDAANTTSTAEATPSSTASFNDSTGLAPSYNIEYWVEHKAQYDTPGLSILFGAHFTKGAVIFNEGKFMVQNLSFDTPDVIDEGSYSFVSDTEIELRFDNSDIAVAKVKEVVDGQIVSIDFPLGLDDCTIRISCPV